MVSSNQNHKGSFNNYVDRILPFFGPPPCVDCFYIISVALFDPLPSHLVHVVIEWPLTKSFLSWGHIVFCHHQNTISYVFCMYLVYFAYITWQYRVPLKFYHSTFRRMFQPKLFENSQVGLRWVWPTDYGFHMKPFCNTSRIICRMCCILFCISCDWWSKSFLLISHTLI